MKRTTLILIAGFAITFAAATDARALARTFVSINGNDSGPCSPVAPCRTLTVAIANVFEGGEVVIVDSGLVGNVEINKSVTIMGAPGVHAGIGFDTKSGTAVTINAPADSTVVLRNLYITTRSLNQLFYGIDFISGKKLRVENCVVAGFKRYGIRFNLQNAICDAGCPSLSVEDSFIHGNVIGIGTRAAIAVIEHSRIEDNQKGIEIGGGSQVTVRDGIIASNSEYGISLAYSSTARIESCSVTDNRTGLFVLSDAINPGFFYVSDTLISGNDVGLKYQSGDSAGTIYSFGNNRLFGNATNGQFTTTLQQQ